METPHATVGFTFESDSFGNAILDGDKCREQLMDAVAAPSGLVPNIEEQAVIVVTRDEPQRNHVEMHGFTEILPPAFATDELGAHSGVFVFGGTIPRPQLVLDRDGNTVPVLLSAQIVFVCGSNLILLARDKNRKMFGAPGGTQVLQDLPASADPTSLEAHRDALVFTAVREAFEEVGIVVSPGKLRKMSSVRFDGKISVFPTMRDECTTFAAEIDADTLAQLFDAKASALDGSIICVKAVDHAEIADIAVSPVAFEGPLPLPSKNEQVRISGIVRDAAYRFLGIESPVQMPPPVKEVLFLA